MKKPAKNTKHRLLEILAKVEKSPKVTKEADRFAVFRKITQTDLETRLRR